MITAAAGATETGQMILVVDDHADAAEALTKSLRARGYPSASVSNGPEALAFVRAHPPEQPLLVVLDHMMPDMSGMDTLKAIRADPKIATAPVMFYTAGFDTLRRDEAMSRGALAWMFKGQPDVTAVLDEIGHLYERVGGAKTVPARPASRDAAPPGSS
jgi:CheY-like chemotaxis protein